MSTKLSRSAKIEINMRSTQMMRPDLMIAIQRQISASREFWTEEELYTNDIYREYLQEKHDVKQEFYND